MNWIYNNTDRIPLDRKLPRTIKFKSLFPTFDIWKTNLKSVGVKESDIIESDFIMLQYLISNSYLLYKTDNKNIGHIGFTFRRLISKRERRKYLYNKQIDELIYNTNDTESENEFTNKNFIGNRTQNNQLEDDYFNNANKQTNKQTIKSKQGNISTNINNVLRTVNLEDPELIFLIELKNAIIYPTDFDNKGELFYE